MPNASRLSAELLQKSITHFNRAAQSGFDEQFDRDPSTLEPIAQAQFYAMPVSIAGLKTDRNKQVLRWDNTPIEGLYAAGETAPVSQFVHDRGGHLSECLVFGRHVGRIAAAMPKRGRQ
ncbi:FAD-binding protein [Sutterella wadsworthensis]|uniref:FAD-binding protein n=1 Tax=Sutterella wadsworthensis TaxID=40545 RepID=UPI003080D7D1